MSGIAVDGFQAARTRNVAVCADGTGLAVEVISDFSKARALFDQFADGIVTPYQRFHWLSSYFRHVDAPAGARLAIVVLRSAAGVPQLVLPLSVRRKGPVRIAAFIGGKHSNFNMPLVAHGFRPDETTLKQALRRAGQLAGIDLFALMAQPLDWEGHANPLALLGGQVAASAGYKLALAADGEAMLKERLSKDARKKLRQKEQKLQAMGTLTHVMPGNAAEALAVLAAFLDMKAARFGTQGIDDPFAGADVRAFLEECVARGFGSGGPTVVLHALALEGKPVSIYGGLTDGRRFCGLFTAFDGNPEISRHSPGDILLMAMIRHYCAEGYATFDLGVGEARYKAQVCDAKEELRDLFLPVTLAGRAGALALSAAQNAKRRIKGSAAATAFIAKLRKLRAG